MNIEGKGPLIAGRVLTGLIGVLLAASALGKLARAAPVVELFARWGLADHLMLIGLGELVTAALLLIPATFPIGLLLASAYLGGAIVTHMQHAEGYAWPSVLLVILWVGAFLRRPWIFAPSRPEPIPTTRPLAPSPGASTPAGVEP